MNKCAIGFCSMLLALILVGCTPVTVSPTSAVLISQTPTITVPVPSLTPTPTATITVESTRSAAPSKTKSLISSEEFTDATGVPTRVTANTRTPVPSETPAPPSTEEIAQATIESFGPVCEPPTEDRDSEISPDGRWIATICKGRDENEQLVAYLRVFSVQGDKAWIINHSDYTKGLEENTDGVIYPFHWATDGKYFYATSPSRISGCCWVGGFLLLVRLNLVTGQQTEIANYMSDDDVMGVGFSISSSNQYILITPQDGEDNLYILDTYTWKQDVIKLDVILGSGGEALMSPDDKKVILLFREYPDDTQGDFTFGSIVLLDLESGSQTRLVTGMDFTYTPIPRNWLDNDHVLMYENGNYWILNIQAAELTETDKP